MVTASSQSTPNSPAKTGVALGVLLVVIVVFALAFVLRHIYSDSSGAAPDPRLKRAATAMVPILSEPASNYTREVSFFQTYGHWVRDLRSAMKRATGPLAARHQFAQLQLIEDRTVPPDYLLLTTPGQPTVTVDGAAMLGVSKMGKPIYSDAQADGRTVHGYFVRVPVPDQLSGEQVAAVLEVFQE